MFIDRIEGALAVVEVAKGVFKDIPLAQIDGGASKGSVLVENGDRYSVDTEATNKRSSEIQEKMKKVFKD